MELRQLRYFVAVAEELHFGAAAQKVCIVQPALSRQVRDLEAEIGTDLIDRRGRRVRLTRAGSMFADHARRILQDIDIAVTAVRLAARDHAELLRLGMAANLAAHYLGPIIQAWCDVHPTADVDLRSLDMAALLAALQDNKIDVGIGPIPSAKGQLIAAPLWQESMTVALPSRHLLASSKVIDPCDIGDDRILLPTCNSDFLFLAKQVLHDAGISQKATQETDNLSTAMLLVAAGHGLALVPELLGRSVSDDVSLVPLRSPKALFEIGLIQRASETSPLVSSFVEIGKEVVRQRLPRTARPPRPRAIAKAV
ncbi:MAG: LysR family transcriptional regulator [Alphaproteobacteria bacterium]